MALWKVGALQGTASLAPGWGGAVQGPPWLCWGSSGLQASFLSWFHTPPIPRTSGTHPSVNVTPLSCLTVLLVFTEPGSLFLVNY